MNTDMLLLEELWSVSSPSHYALVNRVIRVHLKNLALVIEVAKELSLLSYYPMRASRQPSRGMEIHFQWARRRDVDTHDSSVLRVVEFDGNHP